MAWRNLSWTGTPNCPRSPATYRPLSASRSSTSTTRSGSRSSWTVVRISDRFAGSQRRSAKSAGVGACRTRCSPTRKSPRSSCRNRTRPAERSRRSLATTSSTSAAGSPLPPRAARWAVTSKHTGGAAVLAAEESRDFPQPGPYCLGGCKGANVNAVEVDDRRIRLQAGRAPCRESEVMGGGEGGGYEAARACTVRV